MSLTTIFLISVFSYFFGVFIGTGNTKREAKRENDILFNQYCGARNEHDNLVFDFQIVVTELENHRNLTANYLGRPPSDMNLLRYKKANEILESIKRKYPNVLVET